MPFLKQLRVKDVTDNAIKKTALVTGGSGVIGAAICSLLAARDFHVLVHANRSAHRATELAQAISDRGGSAEAVCFDVTDRDACAAALVPFAQAQPVQLIVHNAGIHDDAPLAGMSGKQWDSVLDVSLNGFYNVVQPLLLHMIGTRWGRIISMSSVAATLGNRGQANYAAAKAGLHGASRALAVELASRGVTVNVVAPGIIQSEMASGFAPEQIASMVPMKRAGRPEEVAAVVGFLASDEAGYVSGQVIGVNGGMI
jgi:3-oxoacyl-[acyl-carrier protein] reductase